MYIDYNAYFVFLANPKRSPSHEKHENTSQLVFFLGKLKVCFKTKLYVQFK